MDRLKGKIENKTARIGIIGIGYVGLPLAVEFAKAGFNVTGFDTDGSRIASVKKGVSYVLDVASSELKDVVSKNRFSATGDRRLLGDMDAIIICVPTPLRKTKEPDISFILSATEDIAANIRKGQLIILESTTYPGTTEEVILSRLSSDGLRPGEDFCLAFSPERVDPGNPIYKTKDIPKVVGGVDRKCTELARLLYSQIIKDVIPVSGTKAAEMVKLLENTFRAVNIGLINEIAILCNKMGLDIWEIIDAAKTKPFGFMAFYPGPGLGGHCLPSDPLYLSWKARVQGFDARLIEVAQDVNSCMPAYVVERIIEALNKKGKALKGSDILIIGVTYKRDVNDIRESPALSIMHLLKEKGAKVKYYDPLVREFDFEGNKVKSIEFNRKNIASSDCVCIVTDHSSIDYAVLAECTGLILDTRNVLKGFKNKNIVRL